MKKTIIACVVTLFLCVICLTGCVNPNFYPTNETGDNTNHQADVPDDPMTTVSETVEETEAETEDEYGILMKDRIYVSINNIEDGRKPITYDDVKDKYNVHMYDASELFREDAENFEKVKKENVEDIHVSFPWMMLDLEYVCSYISADHPEHSYDVFANKNGIRCEVLADGTLRQYNDVLSNNRVGDLTVELPYEEYARMFIEHWYGEGYLDDYEANVDNEYGTVVTFRKRLHGYSTPDTFTLFMYHEGSVCHFERKSPGYNELYKNLTVEQIEATKETLLAYIDHPGEPSLVLANDGYLYMKISDYRDDIFYYYYTRLEP